MIVITGASWSQFQYTNDAFPDGPGIADYLSMCGDVLNIGRGGASNLESLEKLRRVLHSITDHSTHEYFWIVTDPTRDIEYVTDMDSITDALELAYRTADNIAKEYGVTIQLIGGECDIKHPPDYKNLIVVIPSIGKLADPNYPVCIGHDTYRFTKQTQRSGGMLAHIVEVERKVCYLSNPNNSNYFKASHPSSKLHLLVARAMLPHVDKYYREKWENKS
jgi:hypothetical protein